MEFGCRYIYVQESRDENKVQLESQLCPVMMPESQNGVVLGPGFYDNFHRGEEPRNVADVNGNGVIHNPAFYDNFHRAEGPRSDAEVNGLQHVTLSPESNIYLGLQPTSPMQLEGQKTPPPVPHRKKKVSTPPGTVPEAPHYRLSPESDVYSGLQPTAYVKLDGKKTPPPVPLRKKNTGIIASIRNSMHLATNRGQTDQPAIVISSSAQNSRPPVPDRRSKPSIYKPSGVTQPEKLEYDYAVPEYSGPNGVTQPETLEYDYAVPENSRPNDLSHGVTIEPAVHFYLDVLPALPEELKMQERQVNPPDCPLATSPVPPIERLPANCNILLLNIGRMVKDSDVDLPNDNRLEDREEGDKLYAGGSQSENEYSFADQSMIIFCIDISGSMSVTTEVTQDQNNDYNIVYKSRMEAVKSALDQTLDFLHKQNSGKRVALVTFSDQVKLYGDGTKQPLVLQGAELLDPDHLQSQGLNQPTPHPLMETLHALKGKIQCLEEMGATALGPAALVSIAMASKSPGSKVIICTDGRANTDLGNLEDISEEYAYQSSKLYYSNLGDLALQHSVVVSVVTIEGTNCRLPELGQLADKTGGKVNIVHPLNLANEFQSIVEEEIIATNVKLKVFLPETMCFLYEGNIESVLERTFGSITADTVLSTEFDIPSSKTKEVLRYSQLPIELHLTYTLPDGRSRRRVLNEKRPVTNDCSAALESIDLSVLQIHSVQFSARLAMEGHVNEARKVALELKELIDLVMRHEKYEALGVVYEDWENSMAPIYEDLQVYMKGNSLERTGPDSNTEVPVVKTFSDEMAKMIFHMKRAKNRVLSKLRN